MSLARDLLRADPASLGDCPASIPIPDDLPIDLTLEARAVLPASFSGLLSLPLGVRRCADLGSGRGVAEGSEELESTSGRLMVSITGEISSSGEDGSALVLLMDDLVSRCTCPSPRRSTIARMDVSTCDHLPSPTQLIKYPTLESHEYY
jgi:hypothetical protein